MPSTSSPSTIERWDDLRFLLAVHRGGNLVRAGQALGVATSTVSRRMIALERRLGVHLLDRTPGGVGLAAEAAPLIAVAEDVEARLAAGGRDVTGGALEGRVRIAAGDGFAGFLVEVAAAFRAEHPGVIVELAFETRLVDLVRREADLAVRTVRPTADSLTIRRLGDLPVGLYASDDYLRRAPPLRSTADLARHDVVGFDGRLDGLPEMRWLQERGGRVIVRSNLVDGLVRATAAGLGVAPLAHAVADGVAGLRRVLPEVDLEGRTVWLAMPRDLRRVPRMRGLADAIAAAFTARTAPRAPRRDRPAAPSVRRSPRRGPRR